MGVGGGALPASSMELEYVRCRGTNSKGQAHSVALKESRFAAGLHPRVNLFSQATYVVLLLGYIRSGDRARGVCGFVQGGLPRRS